jgi:putative transposase
LLFWRATDCTIDDAQAHARRSAHCVGFGEPVAKRGVEMRKKSLSLRRLDAVSVAVNAVRGIDITYLHRGRRPAFAIIDHGSRRLLRFAALPRKCSFTLLGHLCLTIADFGLPRAIRSDNESMFTSLLWRSAMRWLGVRHQRSAPGRPW